MAAAFESLLNLQFPYPGLRPFETSEAFLFFGRQKHTDDLLRRLSEGRFLAVVGTSGSGKSSLVKAGLLPALYRGFLVGTTSRWRIVTMRPGSAPMKNLAEALRKEEVGPTDEAASLQLVSRSSRGLAEAVGQSDLGAGESVLIVVDQFEELFRFQRARQQQDGGAEASLFVAALLDAAESFGAPVYVVITMRSDFLGDCTQFAGLAEALNGSQYLIPRLTREQRREAIERPLAMVGASMTDRLIQRLLVELGDEQDQLPVLQHALNRTFHVWKSRADGGALDLDDYADAGGLKGALNDHAEAVLTQLPANSTAWAERLFRALTTIDNGRAVRRPDNYARICQVSGAANEAARMALGRVVNEFASASNSLLVLSPVGELQPETVVDISHEALIRNWRRLGRWLEDERAAVDWYRDVAADVVLMGTKEASTWRDPKLAKALTFRNAGYWNQAWAESNLLGGGAKYLAVTEFLDLSAREQVSEREAETARHQKELEDARALAESERQRRRWLTIAASLGLFVIVAGLTTVYFMERSRDLEVQRKADQALLGAEQARANEAIALFDRQIQRNKELLAALEGLQKESGSAARERQRLSAEVAKLRQESNDLARQRVEAEREKERVYGDIKNKGFNPDQIRQSRPAATAN